jgi:hypothetical protein
VQPRAVLADDGAEPEHDGPLALVHGVPAPEDGHDGHDDEDDETCGTEQTPGTRIDVDDAHDCPLTGLAGVNFTSPKKS